MKPYFNRRGFLGVSAGVTIAAGLVACSGSNGTPTGGTSPGGGSTAQGVREQRFMTYIDEPTFPAWQEQIAKFDAENNAKTTISNQPGSGAAIYPDKLRTELLGGSGPDVWRIWGGSLGAPFARAGQALDLGDLYAERGWDSRINAAASAGMNFDGMQAGVPSEMRGVGAWFNREVLENAGVTDLPTSYAELEEMNEQILASGITPAGMAGKYGWHVMRLFEYLLETSAGPELHDALLVGEESWDTPEVVTAFANLQKWQENGWLPDGAVGLDPSDVEPQFVQGRVAYTLSGTWAEGGYIHAAGQDSSGFGVFQLPTDQEVVRHSGFVEGYMINANTENVDLAADLIDFIIDPETSRALAVGASTVEGAGPDPDEMPLSHEWNENYGESPFYTIQDQAFPKQQADQFFSVQSDVLQKNITPEEAAKQMEEVISAWVAS